MASKAARVSHVTARRHRRDDPDFEAQCIAAEEHAVELLHDVTFKSALEGDCEPVFWQGIKVGHIKKFDNRLRIEMLRAHLPAKFKTPGSGAGVAVSAPGASLLIVTPEVQAELMAMRQESLRAIEEKKARAIEVAN
jgi:hypothetical protein